MNIASIGGSPVLVSWRGTTFLHRDTLEIPWEIGTFDINVAGLGLVEHRVDAPKIPISLTPSGRVQEVGALINRYSTAKQGDKINVEEFDLTIDIATNIITTDRAHLLANGDEVMCHAYIAMAGGLSDSVRYYANAPTSTTVKLYNNEVNAIAGGATGLIDITSTGDGMVLDVTRALTLTTAQGLQIKFWNVGLTKIPDFIQSSTKTMLGSAEFTAFVRNGQDPEVAAGRYYTIKKIAGAPFTLSRADIKTQTPKLSWEFDPAWTNRLTKDGAKVAFDLKTAPCPNDAFGDDAVGLWFDDISLTATVSPQGLTEAQIAAGLQLEARIRGESLTAGALDLVTPYYTFTIADAILNKAPLAFAPTEQRAGDFEWKSQKQFTLGSPDPVYELIVNS